MTNFDEAILRGKLIQPTAPFPVLHQALRIALYDEYAARAYYAAVVQAFGPQPPFTHIVQSEVQHIEVLSRLCERYGVPRPIDPFPAETTVAPTWRANLERGVAGEIANIRLYDYLPGFVAEPDVRQVFGNLQAASLNNHLPAFQRALAAAVARESWHVQQGIPPSQAYVRHGLLTDALERGFALLARQHGAFGLVGSLVRATHPVMLAGMVAGGAAVQYLRQSKSRASTTLSPTKEN
ncbi:MAG: ferritin-like domain-containing protein [Rhodocyclaceae bacterium]